MDFFIVSQAVNPENQSKSVHNLFLAPHTHTHTERERERERERQIHITPLSKVRKQAQAGQRENTDRPPTLLR